MSNKLIHALFNEEIASKKWMEIDFQECQKSLAAHTAYEEKNPLLDPVEQGKFLKLIHEKASCDYSWGGYLEDRSLLWKGSYLEKGKAWHLGIDFNVPEHTQVLMPISGTVCFVGYNNDQNGGWGGRLDFYNDIEKLYFILGHLSPAVRVHKPFSHLEKGVKVGFIGESNKNGGWFPHLHLQVVSPEEYRKHENPFDIDGYGQFSDDICNRYPNPKVLVE